MLALGHSWATARVGTFNTLLVLLGCVGMLLAVNTCAAQVLEVHFITHLHCVSSH